MTASRSSQNGAAPSWTAPVLQDSPYLGQEERQLLELGKAEHKETTAAAKRALKVAQQTQDVAQGTLVEMHRQGEQLERAELGMAQVGSEIEEASAILHFMRRWCCLQCCDCCDPTLEQDLTRKKRVAAVRQALAFDQQNAALQYGAKQQAVSRTARQHDPAHGGSEGVAPAELLAQAGAVREAWQGPRATDIGLGLPDGDRREVRQETEKQDELLDGIGDAVQSLHAMSKEMYGELAQQEQRLDRLHDRTTATHDQLGALSREARRI